MVLCLWESNKLYSKMDSTGFVPFYYLINIKTEVGHVDRMDTM